jgi:hypothetical protein
VRVLHAALVCAVMHQFEFIGRQCAEDKVHYPSPEQAEGRSDERPRLTNTVTKAGKTG